MGGYKYLKELNNSLSSLVIMLSANLLIAVVVTHLYAIFRELRLRIDRQQISYSSHLLGLRWNNSKPAPRRDICQLEIEQVEYTIPDTKQKLSRFSQMSVQAGNQKYRLGVEQKLSESEIEWLATELSQWLGLKIKKTLKYSKATEP